MPLAFGLVWALGSLPAHAESAREQAQRLYQHYAKLDGPVREAKLSFEAQRQACEAANDGSGVRIPVKSVPSRAPAPPRPTADVCQTLPDQERKMWRQIRPLLEEQSQVLERAYCVLPSFQLLFLMAQVLETRRLTTQAAQYYQEFNHCLDLHMQERQRAGSAAALDPRCGPSWQNWDDKQLSDTKDFTNARLSELAAAPDQVIDRFNALSILRERCQRQNAPAKRPAWRIGVGFTGLLLGAVAVGAGAFNLAQPPACVTAPERPILDCPRQAYPQPLDVTLTASGIVSMVAGSLLWAWPATEHRPRKEDSP